MTAAPFIDFVKHYMYWEIAGVALAAIGRAVYSRLFSAAESGRARQEAGMSLTANGWETNKLRLRTSAPIRPR